MAIYARDTISSSNDRACKLDNRPKIKSDWPDEDLASFAQEAAATEFGGSWVHPEDRNFTDRPPPGTPAAAKPERIDIVSALRTKRRAG